jgi:hypothetical protein
MPCIGYQLFDEVEHDVGWVVEKSNVVTLCLDFSFLDYLPVDEFRHLPQFLDRQVE